MTAKSSPKPWPTPAPAPASTDATKTPGASSHMSARAVREVLRNGGKLPLLDKTWNGTRDKD
jgi:hypothetical protein